MRQKTRSWGCYRTEQEADAQAAHVLRHNARQEPHGMRRRRHHRALVSHGLPLSVPLVFVRKRNRTKDSHKKWQVLELLRPGTKRPTYVARPASTPDQPDIIKQHAEIVAEVDKAARRGWGSF